MGKASLSSWSATSTLKSASSPKGQHVLCAENRQKQRYTSIYTVPLILMYAAASRSKSDSAEIEAESMKTKYDSLEVFGFGCDSYLTACCDVVSL